VVEARAINVDCFLPVEIIDRGPSDDKAPAADPTPMASAIEINIAELCPKGFCRKLYRVAE